MMKTFFIILLFIINTFCTGDPVMNIGYYFSTPDQIYLLPETLLEISGIAGLNESSIACIQDEHATIYIHDIDKNQIVKEFNIGDSGDYEGIARVNKTLFILRSDGVINEVTNFESGKFDKTIHKTGIEWKDNEGFCYDQKNNRLLIAPKETPGKDSGNKNMRYIYGFSLVSDKLINEPVFRFDLEVIKKFALDNKIKVPMKGKKGEKQEPDLELRISALGIHPVTGNLFAVSGTERILYVFDTKGNIRYIQRLNSDLFRQPEGITFMKNGDMFISSEGKKKPATLVRFNYKPGTVAF